MKKFILAGAAVLSLGVGTAFAEPTIVYTNGSTYDSATGHPPRPMQCAIRTSRRMRRLGTVMMGRRLSTRGRPRVGWAGFEPDR